METSFNLNLFWLLVVASSAGGLLIGSCVFVIMKTEMNKLRHSFNKHYDVETSDLSSDLAGMIRVINPITEDVYTIKACTISEIKLDRSLISYDGIKNLVDEKLVSLIVLATNGYMGETEALTKKALITAIHNLSHVHDFEIRNITIVGSEYTVRLYDCWDASAFNVYVNSNGRPKYQFVKNPITYKMGF